MAKRSPAGEEPFRPLLDFNTIMQAVAPVGSASKPAEPDRPNLPSSGPAPINQGSDASARTSERRGERLETAKSGVIPQVAEKLDQEKRMLLTRRESEAVERRGQA